MKTHVFYSEFVENKYDSFIEVHSGNISVIVQKNADKEDEWDINTYVEELRVIHLGKGDKLAIPSGVYYAFANTGLRPAVFSMIRSNKPNQVDYESLKREKGLACFIISKNSKVAAVANPKYKMRKKLQSANLEKFMKDSAFVEVFAKPFDHQSEPLVNFMERLDFLKNYIYFA
jgi:oxalate decarboxylase/phosphoglucose isomerase-like protein (cupin superfamily)